MTENPYMSRNLFEMPYHPVYIKSVLTSSIITVRYAGRIKNI